jgi:hypothetical protein
MSDVMPNDEPAVPPAPQLPTSRIWLKELPYVGVLILTLLGVAYTSFTKQPTTGYWEFLVPVTGVVCIWSGWRYTDDKKAQLRLIWTQAAHWQCAENAERGRNRPRYSSFAGSWHICCRHPHSCGGSLHTRFRHGALRPGYCLDRGGGTDRAARCDHPDWSGNDVLVDRNQKTDRDSSSDAKH